MLDPNPTAPSPRRIRVAYLLADTGIPITNSKKGSSIHARSMIRAFELEGCNVTTFVMRKGDRSAKGFDITQVRMSRLTQWWRRHMLDGRLGRLFRPFGGADGAPANWIAAVSWLLSHRDFLRHVRRTLRRDGAPDFFYARAAWLSFPYARLKRLFGVPLVLEVNAVMSIEKAARGEEASAGLTRSMERTMMQAADLILPVSAEIKEQIVKIFAVPEGRVVVTPNAVDLDLFRPPAEGEGPREGEFIIGAVNSFRAYHGMLTLVRAAALLRERIPGLRLLLIGGGPQLTEVREEARRLGLEAAAEFTGVVDHDRVPGLLARCAVCAAPYEGEHNQYNCPMKLFEYMGMKIPIVAARWGDIPNIVEDGRTALLHDPADPGALAGVLEAVWRDPAAARRRAEEAYELAQGKTWRGVARRILEWRAAGGSRPC